MNTFGSLVLSHFNLGFLVIVIHFSLWTKPINWLYNESNCYSSCSPVFCIHTVFMRFSLLHSCSWTSVLLDTWMHFYGVDIWHLVWARWPTYKLKLNLKSVSVLALVLTRAALISPRKDSAVMTLNQQRTPLSLHCNQLLLWKLSLI